MMRRSSRVLLWALPLIAVAAPLRAEQAGVDPKAAEILRASMRYVGGLQKFALETDNTIEVVLASGEKLQFENPVNLVVRRPDHLRAERVGDLVDQLFLYDGKRLTLLDRGRDYYASIDAPPTLDGALDLARDKLDIVAPAADLLYRDAYEALTKGATSGIDVGPAMVGGVRCHHLAFTLPEVDWQLWVEEGDKPLPRKFVITSKQVPGAPEFAVWMRKWDLSPSAPDDLFTFVAPKEAKQIEFLQVTTETPDAR
jgi:hypothetical protein